MKILIINGPNLNFLGIREKNIYGNTTYEDMCKYIYKEAENLKAEVDIKQSNIEGEIINLIQAAYGEYDGIIIDRKSVV